MADIETTLGVDSSSLSADLRKAVREQEAYAREIRRIDRRMGREAAEAFKKVLDAQRAAKAEASAFVRTYARGAASIKHNWAAIAGVVSVVGATTASGVAVVTRSIDQYAAKFSFAERRVTRFRQTVSREMTTFQRDMFRVFEMTSPESLLAPLERVRTTLVDTFGAVMAGVPTLNIFNGMRQIRAVNDAEAALERQDRAIAASNADRALRAADRARLLADTGRTGAAAVARAGIERDQALQRLNSLPLNTTQQLDAVARIEAAYDRTVRRYEGYDASRDLEANMRARAASMSASGFLTRDAESLRVRADLEARLREIRSSPMTERRRAAEIEVARIAAEQRIKAIEREERAQKKLLDIEYRRNALIGRRDFGSRAAMVLLEGERRRVIARRDIRDKAEFDIVESRIIKETLARYRSVKQEQQRAIEGARDQLETIRIERMRRRGQTLEAERAAIRRRFAGIERGITDSLGPGPEAEKIVKQLRDELAKALADAGKDAQKETAVNAPEFLGGFRGVRDRVGGPERRLLEDIRDNTARTVSFVVR